MLIIRNRLIAIGLCLLSLINYAQSDSTDVKSFHRDASLDLVYLHSNPIGDGAYANAIDAGSGIDFSFQINVAKKFYAGLGANLTHHKVTNTAIIGGFDRSRKNDFYLYFGYSLHPLDNLTFGADVGIGLSTFNNKQSQEQRAQSFNDTGQFARLGVQIDYKVYNDFHIVIKPHLQFTNLNVETPDQIQDNFKNVRFYNVGLGIRYAK